MDKCDLCLWNQGSGGGGGSSTLSGLTDVDISNPSNGQTLVYNATSVKWENGSGGGVLVVTISQIDGVETMDKTWQEIHDAAYAVARRHTLGEDYDVYNFTDIATIGHNIGDNAYYFVVEDLHEFASDTANGYPVKRGGPLPGGRT